MRGIIPVSVISVLLFFKIQTQAQLLQKQSGKIEFSNGQNKITVHLNTGLVDYVFTNGIPMENTAAYCTDIHSCRVVDALLLTVNPLNNTL